jgi:hypothetical protein
MALSIAERRAVSMKSLQQPDFRQRLKADARAGIREATGKSLPAGLQIEVIDEGEQDWCFVLLDPASIDVMLPAPMDSRSAVENDVYALLRDQPALAPVAQADPVGFLRERLRIDVSGVKVRKEEAGAMLIVMPNPVSQDELSDELLELVAGGGDPGCLSGKVNITYNASNGNG